MLRKCLGIVICIAFLLSIAKAQEPSSAGSKLSAVEIVDKNIAARGGLQAWRGVKTMTLSGEMGAGGNRRAALPVKVPGQKSNLQTTDERPVEEIELPFVMKLMRPRKMRVELQFNGQTALQVFDGNNGWKLRPFLNRNVVEPYTADEMKMASAQADLDGPLIDYVAKGTKVELDGREMVEGRDNYKLKLQLKTGGTIHVWIDARTFLETKMEGQPRRLDGTDHPVEIYFGDYRLIDGLQIPFLLQTKVLSVAQTVSGLADPPVPTEKTRIESVSINPKLDESLFTSPVVGVASVAKQTK